MADGEGNGEGGAGGEGGGEGGGGKAAPETITLTSAQLDARIQRAATNANRDFIKSLGYEKPEDLQAALKAKKDADDAQLSEVQRATEAARASDARATAAEAQAKAGTIRVAALTAATKAGIPGDRIEAAIRLLDTEALEVGADGRVVGADEAVTALLAGSPWLLADAKGGTKEPVGTGAGGGAGGEGAGKPIVLSDAQKSMAKAQGLTEAEYARGLTGAPGTPTHEAYVQTHQEEAAKAGSKS